MPQPTPDDLRACRTLLRSGSRSFFLASLLLQLLLLRLHLHLLLL